MLNQNRSFSWQIECLVKLLANKNNHDFNLDTYLISFTILISLSLIYLFLAIWMFENVIITNDKNTISDGKSEREKKNNMVMSSEIYVFFQQTWKVLVY